MERLLARLERRLGRFALPNLTYFIAVGMAGIFVLTYARPEIESRLVLDMHAVRQGEVWRLVTYLFLPPPAGSFLMPRPIAMMFAIYFFWLMGTNLEHEWGAFKLNAFYLVGMVGTTITAVIFGGAGNFYLTLTLFFAFATIFPDYQILLFFILPVKVKWLAWLSAAWMAWELLSGDWESRAAIGAAMGNYVLFFGGHWMDYLKSRNLRVRQAARRASATEAPKATGGRVCAICGKREEDGADIRVCSCAKCGGTARNLCLEHARNH